MAHVSSLSTIMFAARLDLRKVLRPTGMVFASDDKLFRYAFFGRDSIEVAEDLLPYRRDFIYKLIIRLAELQGTLHNQMTEEEPGKIHHEYRAEYMEGKLVPSASLGILQTLSRDWGGTGQDIAYYGAADTTALYIRLVARYQQMYQTDLLSHAYVARDGQTFSIAQSIEKALGWLTDNLQKFGWVSFKRHNVNGILCQTWKDSPTSIVHSDGSLPNYSLPIATIELQAQAYDALMMGGDTLKNLSPDAYTDKAAQWQNLAKDLQQRTLDTMWLPTVQRFATGLDQDATGSWRLIGSNTSNQGALLESTMLHNLPESTKHHYVPAIVKNLYSNDFLTSVGVRCRSLHEFANVDFQDYHGSWAVWLKETYDVAKGFRAHGFGRLADQLELRILLAVSRAGANREFFYVSPTGSVLYQPAKQQFWRRTVMASKTIEGTNIPEQGQAWSASAVYSIVSRRASDTNSVVLDANQRELEDALLLYLPTIDQTNFLLPNRIMGFMTSQRS